MKLVVLVPGFAASHLARQDGIDGRREKIWLSQLDIAWNGVLELDTDPAVSPPTLDKVIPTGILQEVYQPFTLSCMFGSLRLAYFPYDWRTDVATNGARLAAALNLWANEDVEITLVGHSLGGLVVASGVNRVEDLTMSRIKRVIFCAVPWSGSYRAVELFTGYHDLVVKIISLNRILSRRSKEEWRKQSVRVVASWPGAYDLLPMPDLMGLYPGSFDQDFRNGTFFAQINPWFNVARYNEAVARRPIHVGFPGHIEVRNWRGCGRRTPGPMPTWVDGLPDFYFQAIFGDTTVPEASSFAPPAFNAIRQDFDADHEQFMNDPAVLALFGRVMGVLR